MDEDGGLRPGRIHLFGRRMENDVDAGAFSRVQVVFPGPGVGVEVLTRHELGRIDKYRRHRDVVFGNRPFHQGQVPFVERAHGRDKPAFRPPGGDVGRFGVHFLKTFDNAHS